MATSFDDVLQWVNAQLQERLQFFKLDPACILDLGAGTCRAALALRQRYAHSQVIALDLAPERLHCAPRSFWRRKHFHRVCADASALPICDRSVDLVYSSLMLPFCAAPNRVFSELARILKPGGLFVFSTLGPQTSPPPDDTRVAAFMELPQLGTALSQSGLAEPVLDVDSYSGFEIIFGAAFGGSPQSAQITGSSPSREFSVPISSVKRRST